MVPCSTIMTAQARPPRGRRWTRWSTWASGTKCRVTTTRDRPAIYP
jgi:hypothetical protein